ncbi:hypothetical protein PIB30_023508 [Stylosanthes scabra]|uniref:F-box domain-containing protein n=1 Tax=Stylosanthes scabra TaxID=79078 RepID=A0ABU6T985_9FABA|nr:hypothetical protein [Stylosanthes scabra]
MDLPLELLDLIFQRLSLIDNLMNCRATCRSWRNAADAIFTSKLPLMLSLTACKTPPASFCSRIVMKKGPNFATLSAPWSNHDEPCTVLTPTWPGTIDSTDIIRVHSVQGCYEEDESLISRKNMKQRLAFIKFKQGSWIEIKEKTNEIFYDIAVDDDDKLYGLTFKHNTSVVFVINLKHHHHKRLFMLNTIKDIGEVFDIGDRFLLWDYTRVSFVSTKGLTLPDKFKGGNCIFFCHANTYSYFHHQGREGRGREGRGRGQGRFQFEDHDMGVFFLGDRTITRFPISSSLPFSYQNMWFIPTPAPILKKSDRNQNKRRRQKMYDDIPLAFNSYKK